MESVSAPAVLPNPPSPPTSTLEGPQENELFAVFKEVFNLVKDRVKKDPYFKWALLGGSIYAVLFYTETDCFIVHPVRKVLEFCLSKVSLPESLMIWTGEIEAEIPFGRVGFTRCLESDPDVLEKFGIPLNAEKCIRDGITYIPGEFYQQFDLTEFDPKVTPLAWTYGPITDPGLIMPIGWYNDMSGENQEYERFCKYMKIFGHIPLEACEELYQHCKIRLLRCNQHLIKIGEPDDKIYIVLHGAVDVYSNKVGPFGEFIRLRTATHGGQVSSLASIIDAITGHSKTIRSIFAISKLNTTKVLSFPIAVLKDYLLRHQEYLVPAVVRLLERVYKFQYQILHKAMKLTGSAVILDIDPVVEVPTDTTIPSRGSDLSDALRDKAIRSFMEYLDIDDLDFLRESCEVLVYEPDDETNDVNTIKESILNQQRTAYKYVYAGKLEQFHLKANLEPMEQRARRKPFPLVKVPEVLAITKAGQGVGGLTGILTYDNALFYRCSEKSIIVTLDGDTLQRTIKTYPLSIFPIAYMPIARMSYMIRAMDFAIEWAVAKEGQYIYHKEQMCYDSYLILNGRARAYQLDSFLQQRAIFEYKENDWIGRIESLLQSKRRSKTCVVIRETEFVKIPNDLLRNIVMNYSAAAQVMLSALVERSQESRRFEMDSFEMKIDSEGYRSSRRIHSIGLVPVSEKIPYSILAAEIKRHYNIDQPRGQCTILTFESVLAALKMEDFTAKDRFQIETYILYQLEHNDLVIFICLPRMHQWNKIISRHTEIVFSVVCSGTPDIPTKPPDYEEIIVGSTISSRRKELIILHRMNVVMPSNTKEWLYYRDWVHFHHHIRLPTEAFDLPGAISEEAIEAKYQNILYREVHPSTDLSRFGRWLQGRTIGVLFSSGGARIGAQLGMLQALLEYKYIPIDMVVGAGAGFLIAALYAVYQDYAKVQKIIERFFKDIKSLSRLRWNDITFPYINSGNGKRLLTYIYELFGSIQMEDSWLPCCCVTTNLTSQDVRVDRNGPLWVFVRASLSHINRSPPICDPIDGDFICDGAHSNSLPQDIIKEYGAAYIIAFNTVGGKVEESHNRADPNVNVMRFVTNSISAFFKQLGLANATFENIFNQLALTQTRMYARGLEAVSDLKYVIYIRPPVEYLASQNWSNLPALHRIGYFYMKAILDKNPYRKDIPFIMYWTNIKNASSDMANEGGRGVHDFTINNVN